MMQNSGRLSEILRHQATLLEHIVTDPRYYPDYYRVTFYGNFPTAIKDKRFIVSVFVFSHRSSFHDHTYSTGATSGKGLELSVNACSTSILEHSYSKSSWLDYHEDGTSQLSSLYYLVQSTTVYIIQYSSCLSHLP